jgi:WD40 repeat protein
MTHGRPHGDVSGVTSSADGPQDPSSRITDGDASFGFDVRSPSGPGPLAPGTELGDVTIVRLLGEGGMGCVYEGRQRFPARSVAVKVMRPGAWSSSAARRFAYEAHVLARLRHPNIAQIHSFGTHADAHGERPFFVMELVEEGRSLTCYAADTGLPIRDRVALFRRACAAVAHGHRKGVIHRDLKPANILCDRVGDPKVIDYGVARSLDADRDATAITREGDVVGTLRYMSPEQLGMRDDDVGTGSDVYSLGLVLHELVCGSLPYDLSRASYLEAARVLGDDAPVPTKDVETVARTAGGMTAMDARALRAIVTACLERSPADRYPTAIELEADLGRWERGESIVARPPTTVEAAVRFARRHRAAALAIASVAAALLVAVVGIGVFSVRAAREAAEARAELYVSSVLLAAEARDRDNVREAGRRLTTARSLVGYAGTARPLELDCLAASLDEAVRTFDGDGGTVTALAWSRDGEWLVSGLSDGTVRIRRHDASRDGATVLPAHAGAVWSLAVAPDGSLLASAGADGRVHLRRLPDGADARGCEGHDGAVYTVAFAPGGEWLVTGSRDGTARIWDVVTGREMRRLVGHQATVYAACVAPDGRTLATASRDRTVRLWDASTGELRTTIEGHDARVFGVAFAPDGARIATASEDGTARVWAAATGEALAVFRHPARVNAVTFVGEGGHVATACSDGVLRVWSVDDGREIARRRGHTGAIWSIAAIPGTARVATGSADGSTRVWDTDATAPPALPAGDRVLSIACSPRGDLVAVGTADSRVRTWDAHTLEPRRTLVAGGGRVNAVRVTGDGRIVAGCDDGAVRIWDAASGDPGRVLALHERRIYAVDVSPDGRLLATTSEDRTMRLWDVRETEAVGPPVKHPGRVFCAAFSPDGALIATAGEDRVARLHRVAGLTETRRFTGHEAAVNWVAFSPDGRLLATASSDATVRLWRVADGMLLASLAGPARQIWKVAFAPDGRRIAAVSADGTAQLWDVASGRATPLLRGHTDQVWAVAFMPDGRGLFTGSWDGTARLWGVAAAEIDRRRQAAR